MRSSHKSKQKALLFVGSASESIDFARALESNLEPDQHVTVWASRVFMPGDVGIDSLLEQVKSCDFGAFIFTPDDLTTIRKKNFKVVRDNVLFELGLFMGRLGRKRAFILVPSGVKVHLPTDLDGVNTIRFDSSRADKVKAVAVACNELRSRIAKLGRFQKTKRGGKQQPTTAINVLTAAKTIVAPPPFPSISTTGIRPTPVRPFKSPAKKRGQKPKTARQTSHNTRLRKRPRHN